MKKLILSIAACVAVTGIFAQNNPIEMLPHEHGDVIVNKCYDASGNLRATMKYTISDSSTIEDDQSSLEATFVMTDTNNEVIDYGTIYVYYDGEDVSFKMSNRPQTTTISDYLSMNTKLMNDFLDYPTRFNDDPLWYEGPFQFDAADYTIKIGERNRDYVGVTVSDREWEGDEKITTPAGDFHAAKIEFDLEIHNNVTKETDHYKATEWYSYGNGIVRTEISDRHGNLIDYSEVTEISRVRG